MALGLAMLPVGAAWASGSLPAVSSGKRPGPQLLYRPLAVAPELQNAPGSVWHAAPILVSGASAYRDGEFLYQDYLYDDHGAFARSDPSDPLPGTITASPGGTYTYPTGPGYDANAADLVELRVKPLGQATAFRVTLNTLVDPSLVGFTIAIGDTPQVEVPWPFGAQARSPRRCS